jgi:hypothetical protein
MIMKKINLKLLSIILIVAFLCFQWSCTEELLDQQPTIELGADAFWQTDDDALTALQGAYSDVRGLFDQDFYWDGHGEFNWGRSRSDGRNYGSSNFRPDDYGHRFDDYYENLYGGAHRVNYVIENINKRMIPEASAAKRTELEAIIGEARLLRGMIYFRLISLWGDVPYIGKIIYDNSEVADISRMPIAQIKDSIIADFTYAAEKLPNQQPILGRAAKPAALAFRGKMQLFWASWNNFGWPELDGFTPSSQEATAAYTAAAADFKRVIEDFGLDLYRNGEPGEIDELGKAEILPNYYDLFVPAGNGNIENIMVFTHGGGVGTSQGDWMMREVGGRSHEGSQHRIYPTTLIADRYQSTITGDFLEPLIPMNPFDNPEARTTPNSMVNPQSYANRDYRMKASIMWDYEMSVGLSGLEVTGWVPYIHMVHNSKVIIDGVEYTTFNSDRGAWGYIYRKYLRNTPGLGRTEGDLAFPVMRLADVFLMYAEATNEINGPQADAIELVNRVRHRGNLPPLQPDKYASKEAFFDAIEQERIVELYLEGQRSFDLRRWRALERVWGPPGGDGVTYYDTHGREMERFWNNADVRDYEQCYIFRIPPSERDRNSNLTQNRPWL